MSEVDEKLDDNILLRDEQMKYFEITNYNVIPLIKINDVIYDKTINIRSEIMLLYHQIGHYISY